MQNDASMPQTANICWGLQVLPAHVTGDKVSILIFQTSDYDAPTRSDDFFALFISLPEKWAINTHYKKGWYFANVYGKPSTALLFLLYSQKSVFDLPMFVSDLPMFVFDLPMLVFDLPMSVFDLSKVVTDLLMFVSDLLLIVW